jgi:hypothetical protein
MRYWVWGENFNFFFKGRRLDAYTDYTLVYAVGNDKGYDDACVVLGEGSTDRRGRIFFKNSVDTCSMPFGMDARADYGAKILLLPFASHNLDAAALASPALEGTHLIRFINISGSGFCDDSVIMIDEGNETSEPIEEEMPNGYVAPDSSEPMPSGYVAPEDPGPMPPGFMPGT